MVETLKKNLLEFMIEHFGPKSGPDLLDRELEKLNIPDVNVLREEAQMEFLAKLINDCFGSFLQEQKLRELLQSLMSHLKHNQAS